MNDAQSLQTSPKATRGQWIGLAVIALPCMLYSMDLTVLNLAVPALSADLKPSASQLLWIIDIYGFMVAGFLITMGNLGDRIGRRRLLLIGAAAFGIASLLAAFASSAEMLIAMRALLGIAGATLAPSTLSLIRIMFHDTRQRTFAIGIWISSYSVGAAIGPVVGGMLLQHFWWGSVFLINVPVMLLLLALGPLLLPEFRDPSACRIDPASVLLSIVAVLLTIYGCKQLAEHGLGWLPLASIALGVAPGIAFLRRQRRLTVPLIDLRLFRNPAFRVAIGTYTLSCFVIFGVFIFIAQHLQLVLGLSPMASGLWMVPWALAFVAGSLATPAIVARIGQKVTIVAGLCIAAVGFVLLAWTAQSSGPAGIALAEVVQSLGLAPIFTLANDLVVGAAPPERAGSAAAVSETSSEFGGALGIAIFGSIGTAIYRATMVDFSLADFNRDLLEAARSTLGAAVEASNQVAQPLGATLLDLSRAAFVRGMQWTASIGAVLMVGAALLVALALKPLAPPGELADPGSQAGTPSSGMPRRRRSWRSAMGRSRKETRDG